MVDFPAPDGRRKITNMSGAAFDAGLRKMRGRFGSSTTSNVLVRELVLSDLQIQDPTASHRPALDFEHMVLVSRLNPEQKKFPAAQRGSLAGENPAPLRFDAAP